MHVVFTGGGTGGHLFPGLAVAGHLAGAMPGVRITFAGCGNRFERRHVAGAGFEYLALRSHPLPRRLPEAFSFLADNLAGYWAGGRFLAEKRVAVVVGLGGYASVPMARAAVRRGVPLVLLEQNAVPGRATRWLAPSATLVCTAFEQAGRYFRSPCPVRVTGNPIRTGFSPALSGNGRSHSGRNGSGGPAAAAPRSNGNGTARRLVILGGSGGARSLNENVPRALYKAAPGLAGWTIVHQSGEPDLDATRQLYRKLGIEATVVPFLADMPWILARSDLAVCRAGGTTLAELAAAGVPAILLPYPHATDNHQRRNADVFASSGGCLTLDERELAGRLDNHLAGAVATLVGDARRRAAMSESIRRLAQPDATWDVATVIRRLASGAVA